MSVSGAATAELSERVINCVRAAAKPVTLNGLTKATKTRNAEVAALREALASAVDTGQVHRWPDYKRVQYFWHSSADSKAREAVLEVASARALTKTGLRDAATKACRGFPAARMESVISSLVAEKRLTALPAFTGSSRLFAIPGENAAYFNAARDFMENKIRRAGFDPAAFFIGNSSGHDTLAIQAGNAADLILDAVSGLEPVRGVPVPTLRLRRHLPNLGKNEFDSGALELRKRQKVFLNLHADPYNISPAEKELLIDGGDGTYYVGIALR